MSAKAAAALALVAVGLVAINERVLAGGLAPLSLSQVRALARDVTSNLVRADPDMIVRIAWIESAFNPAAIRAEPKIGDASVGLMQTLISTAQWLHSDLGFTRLGRPDAATLMDPRQSMYFGGAYLLWLSTYRGRQRGEEFMVRAYNGGPGGADSSATLEYWRRYLDAKRRFG